MTSETPLPSAGDSAPDQPTVPGPAFEAPPQGEASAGYGWPASQPDVPGFVPQPAAPQPVRYPESYRPALGRPQSSLGQPYAPLPARGRGGLVKGLAWLVGGVVAVSGVIALVVERNDHQQATALGEGLWDLKVGRCTGDAALDEDGKLESLDLVPCDEKHYFEAFASMRVPGDSFPGRDHVSRRAQTFCDAEFPVFMGISEESSQYVMVTIYPTQESWDFENDRTIFCLVGDHVGETTGSLKGARK